MGFSNRFSAAFLGRSASSLPLTNGETEVHRCTVVRLTAADGPVAELALSGAPKNPVVIPCFEIHPNAGGMMCHNVLAQKQVVVWSQQLVAAMRVHKLRTRRGRSVYWRLFSWLCGYFTYLARVKVFGRAFPPGSLLRSARPARVPRGAGLCPAAPPQGTGGRGWVLTAWPERKKD